MGKLGTNIFLIATTPKTTHGHQQFSKIGVVKDDCFDM